MQKSVKIFSTQRGISPAILSILAAVFIMAAYNNTFWANGLRIFEGNLLRLALFGVAVFGLVLFVIALFSSKYLQKPFLVLLLLTGGVSSYYMDTLGVMINREMIQNVATTTVQESKHLITSGFVGHLLIYAILPSMLILLVKVKRPAFLAALIRQTALAIGAIGLCVALLFANYKTFAGAIHDHKELMGSFQPGAPLVGSIHYVQLMMATRDVTLQPHGQDAVRGPVIRAARKPVLAVIMVGETARAQNFGLNGYVRDTTPELAARDDVIAFQDVSSCGTATATSLPCMFSRFGRSDYSYAAGQANENLLDVLAHAGIKIIWLDNNTGDKGIAARVGDRQLLTYLDDPKYCSTGECNDGIFLPFLQNTIDNITKDTVLVMHHIGSHGPAYYLRYPKDYERFSPACHSSEFKNCTTDEIVNAYDNTIAYTDHVLAQTIRMLDAQNNAITAMIYVSDHGESLGESGLYLHGTPYFMAPDTQTKVPFVIWLSDLYKSAFVSDMTCLTTRTKLPITHANLFHTVLGLMDIDTNEKTANLDLFSNCSAAAE
ncbi:phosphoethanolamine transferase [Profundibacter sp.]